MGAQGTGGNPPGTFCKALVTYAPHDIAQARRAAWNTRHSYALIQRCSEPLAHTIVNTETNVYTNPSCGGGKSVLVGVRLNCSPYLRRAVLEHLTTAAAHFTGLAGRFYHIARRFATVFCGEANNCQIRAPDRLTMNCDGV
jgi:hypothetical protein